MYVKVNYKNKIKAMKLLNGKWALMLTMVFSFIVLTNCQSQTENKQKVEPKKENIMKNSKEIIVDVRTEEEFEMDGHAEGSVNYPLDQIQNKIEDLKKQRFVQIIPPTPAVAFEGRRICFLYNPSVGLIELLEK